jgi:hypothetical protein
MIRPLRSGSKPGSPSIRLNPDQGGPRSLKVKVGNILPQTILLVPAVDWSLPASGITLGPATLAVVGAFFF